MRHLAIVLLAPTLLGAQDIVGRRERVYSLTERVSAGAAVSLFSHSGTITVTEGTGSTVEYRAEKDDRRGSIEDIGFIVRKHDGGITICAVYDEDDDCTERGIQRERGGWRSDRRRASLRVTVTVPKGIQLRTASGNGDVSVRVAAAQANISTGNGDVRVSDVTGRLEVSTGNGELVIENVGGPVRASTGNGDVSVRTIVGPVSASSGNGDISVDMQKLTGDDDLTFSTGNGHIEVIAPADFSARIEATTGSGRISTDFPITINGRLSPTRLRGSIGDARRQVTLSTGNGSIEIRKR